MYDFIFDKLINHIRENRQMALESIAGRNNPEEMLMQVGVVRGVDWCLGAVEDLQIMMRKQEEGFDEDQTLN